MGFSSAVQWWEQDQLRVLVLGSLAVQYLLFFFADRRKSRIPSWYRFFIWLSYLASDALAIYALATFFNRQKKMQYRSRDLQVMWAPILLIHLGGQLVITAYDIEDNELWKRHIITALSQVTVAVYVFCKSWPPSADAKLLAAAICLFALGAAKCFEKPLALMRASFSSLDRSFDGFDVRVFDGQNELEAYVQNARAAMLQTDRGTPKKGRPSYVLATLLIDNALSLEERHDRLKTFCHLGNKEAYEALSNSLSDLFDLLYTRYPVTEDISPQSTILMWLFFVSSPIVAIVFFHKSRKQEYNLSDIIITFVLLYGTLLLEFASPLWLMQLGYKWCAMVAQHNLIGFFAQTKNPSKLMRFARSLSCEVYVSQCFGMESCDSSKDITNLVHQHIKDGWEKYITNAKSYKEFNDIRGQWTLQHKGCDEQLGWSLEMPLDQSVLIWHLATDFCFYCRHTSQEHAERAQRSRELSNYMMHLLFANPEMLFPGSRRQLFKVAYDELSDIFKGQETPVDEGKLAQKVVDSLMPREDPQESIVNDAVWLYSWLIDIDEVKMWEVIQGVWVEMICFSAGRCRGYLHAKSIGAGGEYLSYIWLLLHETGMMEIFQHRLQRTQNVQLSNDNNKKKNKKKRHLENQVEDATGSVCLSRYESFNRRRDFCWSMASPKVKALILMKTWMFLHKEETLLPSIVKALRMNHHTQGGNFAGPWPPQYYAGASNYPHMHPPTQGGNFGGPWATQYCQYYAGASNYPHMHPPIQGGNFGGPWATQYCAGASNYPGINPPTQGENFAGPWAPQYCQGTSTYQGMNGRTEGSNIAGPCFPM